MLMALLEAQVGVTAYKGAVSVLAVSTYSLLLYIAVIIICLADYKAKYMNAGRILSCNSHWHWSCRGYACSCGQISTL